MIKSMSLVGLALFLAFFACVQCFYVSTSSATKHRFLQPSVQKQTLSMMFNFRPSSPSSSLPTIPKDKKIVVITGTTSGLGKETMRCLLEERNNYYVVSACRDVENMKKLAEDAGFDPARHCVLELDLASFQSTRNFVTKLNALKKGRPLDRLVCNAAVYQPALMKPKYTDDGIEQQLQINHLSHFLLCSLLINDMKKAPDPRMIIVGSITGNSNTVGGGAVLPLADLGDLAGMEKGSKEPIAMIDGKVFNGAKAYKDSKICNMMTVRELHKRYHQSTGITFSSMYPGCIAETQLFREKRQWFRTLFPLFMRYVTGGYVSEREAGQRLTQVIDDEICKKSGIYWGWNGGAKTIAYWDFSNKNGILKGAGGAGGEIFEGEVASEVANPIKSKAMWEYSTQITGAKWP